MKFMNKPTSLFVGVLDFKMSNTCYAGADCSLVGYMNRGLWTEKWMDRGDGLGEGH